MMKTKLIRSYMMICMFLSLVFPVNLESAHGNVSYVPSMIGAIVSCSLFSITSAFLCITNCGGKKELIPKMDRSRELIPMEDIEELYQKKKNRFHLRIRLAQMSMVMNGLAFIAFSSTLLQQYGLV